LTDIVVQCPARSLRGQHAIADDVDAVLRRAWGDATIAFP